MGGVVPIPLRFVLARLHWARSVRRPGALARAGLFPVVPVGAGGWGTGAGRAPALLSGGGGGTIAPASGRGGRGPRGLRAGGGAGGGGGSRRGLPAPPLGGGPQFPTLAPLLLLGHSPPACAFGRGRGAAPGGGGMRGGPWTAPPGTPPDQNPPSALPEWAMVMGGVMGGTASILIWCAAVRRFQAWSARRCRLARRPRPRQEPAAWGRRGARCAGPAASPPPASRSLLGEGGRPLGSGGAASLLWPSSWGGGGGGGGGWGGRPTAPRPPRPVGRRPAICCPRPAPPGYTRAVGVAGRPRASGAARSAANGSVGWGGGEGGGNPPALVRAPVFPRPASEGAAPCAPSWAPPVRRRSAAGRAGACEQFTGGACRGRGVPSPRVQRPLPGGCGAAVSSVCLRPLLGLRGRGGGVGGALWSSGAAP